MSDMDEGKRPDRLDLLLTDYFRPESAAAELPRRIAAAARESSVALERLEARLGIEATARGISRVGTGPVGKPATAAARKLIEQARQEIHEYLRGQRAFFRVPVDLTTVPDFQRSVLQAAGRIPFGEARAYAWIAARIGHPRAVRAVGTALGRNPVPLILPCHRVWRSDGGLGGYIFGGGRSRTGWSRSSAPLRCWRAARARASCAGWAASTDATCGRTTGWSSPRWRTRGRWATGPAKYAARRPEPSTPSVEARLRRIDWAAWPASSTSADRPPRPRC